ncbi:Dihydroorotate oxidase [Metschnikowia bicuspidata var. bicuspidata NRRL YB-4993]|uniref:Dihydroorotate dehydrogenase (quinone), mitochondrial n=1 Tax=Metschnikowia bicuspidata var. bicuspidata NRRL YB-4993 TaxID=869754 RepID=A0A1A0HBB5_9ASCO|nr:Dihydroorotate oxidase [Metschnikowia bicuspidata var. bicuspidata NRRL YB-4993]OBA21280.1 Dihydroorotate oxidase [Metschnikowia bicuspidata var. bicuspidata NRRL YB-4993]
MWRFIRPSAKQAVPAARKPLLQASVFPRSILFLAGAGAATAAGIYVLDARAGIHEYVFCPLIRMFTDAETGHKVGVLLMKYGLVPRLPAEDRKTEDGLLAVLGVDVFGTRLRTPIGLAAGLDKDGEAIDSLFDTGFSYVEIGSITPEPQPGNPQPRFFRLPRDDAVINRYGFNSTGHFNVVATLARRFLSNVAEDSQTNAFRDGKLLGINLGKNKAGDEVEDYVKGVSRLGPYADVLIVNVSSPNTPGLRDLQSELKLTSLLTRVVGERERVGQNKLGRKPPVLVKVAPDLTEPEIESIANSAKTAKVDGIIISNTTVQRPLDLYTTDQQLISQAGGLSGKPVKPLSLQALRTLRKYTKDSDLVLIGCGGISSGKDALEFGKAGATFVELYTAFAYKGPGLPAKIRDELAQLLVQEGKTWQQIIGEDDK